MNYIKLLIITLSIHITTQTADQWPAFSPTNTFDQEEPLYYNQPHISLHSTPSTSPSITGAPAIATLQTPLSMHNTSVQRISPTIPTHIPHPIITTPTPSTHALRPLDLFTHHNKAAVIAAIHAVIKKRHLQRRMDAETFQALMSNPILAHTRSWAARTLRQSARPQPQQQSLHNTPNRQPSARL